MVNLSTVLYLASYALVFSSLMAAGIKDYESRLINDKYWIPAIMAVPVSIYVSISNQLTEVAYIIDVTFGLIMAALTYLGKLMGEADSIAILLLSLGVPPIPVTNPVILLLNLPLISVFVNSVIPIVTLLIINVHWNLRNRIKCGEGRGSNLINIILLKCVSVEDVMRNPLAYSSPNSSILKASSDSELYVANMPRDRWVWMQYNYPYVLVLAISYVIYLAMGDLIINLALMHAFASPIVWLLLSH